MRLVFAAAWDQYIEWQRRDARILRRINELIRDTLRSPYDGAGKPEPLRHQYAGLWSRRITEEHRMVYRVEGDDLVILQRRYHY